MPDIKELPDPSEKTRSVQVPFEWQDDDGGGASDATI